MEPEDHLRLIATALWRWFVTRAYDALFVALLWFAGLWILGVPWSLFWAMLAGLLHFIPHFGLVLALIGPAIAGGISGGWMRAFEVLLLYVIVAVVDGLFVQPALMKGIARVPFWASLIVPILLGVIFNFWAFLFAPPLLAVFYACRTSPRRTR
jgi:predicted PurR-regulated permease PerM